MVDDDEGSLVVLHTGIVITNDGNAILREIDVSHPAAKVCEGSCVWVQGTAARAPMCPDNTHACTLSTVYHPVESHTR